MDIARIQSTGHFSIIIFLLMTWKIRLLNSTLGHECDTFDSLHAHSRSGHLWWSRAANVETAFRRSVVGERGASEVRSGKRSARSLPKAPVRWRTGPSGEGKSSLCAWEYCCVVWDGTHPAEQAAGASQWVSARLRTGPRRMGRPDTVCGRAVRAVGVRVQNSSFHSELADDSSARNLD